MRILLLSLGILFASELEVQGDLKVSGSIDAQNNPVKNVGTPQSLTDAINGNVLQDALRDNSTHEYLSYKVYLHPTESNNLFKWILLGDGSDISWQHDFTSELNTRALEGYQIHEIVDLPYTIRDSQYGTNYTNNLAHALIILKREIQE